MSCPMFSVLRKMGFFYIHTICPKPVYSCRKEWPKFSYTKKATGAYVNPKREGFLHSYYPSKRRIFLQTRVTQKLLNKRSSRLYLNPNHPYRKENRKFLNKERAMCLLRYSLRLRWSEVGKLDTSMSTFTLVVDKVNKDPRDTEYRAQQGESSEICSGCMDSRCLTGAYPHFHDRSEYRHTHDRQSCFHYYIAITARFLSIQHGRNLILQ